jgi:hypothetical protein
MIPREAACVEVWIGGQRVLVKEESRVRKPGPARPERYLPLALKGNFQPYPVMKPPTHLLHCKE